MKSHRRKAALLSALLLAIGLAALPLEGAAFKIKDPFPDTQPGEPDEPYGRVMQVRPELSWLSSIRLRIWFIGLGSPVLIAYKSSAPRVASSRSGAGRHE